MESFSRRLLFSFAAVVITIAYIRLEPSPLQQVVGSCHQIPPVESMEFVSASELEAINARIIGPEEYGKGCPPGCGCPSTPSDCPQHFEVTDVIKSAAAVLDTATSLHFKHQLERHHVESLQICKTSSSLITGGYCLSKRKIRGTFELPDGRVVPVASGHVQASEQVGVTITALLKEENVLSITDFGANVGKYGYFLKTQIPDLIYHGYDGTGDIESFTNGFIKFADLTLPLDLPVTEWVLSLEVGEHIPSKFEGMFFRNLHRHNCQGVILSWGVLGQRGENHVNLHSNDYVTNVFDKLGYERDYGIEKELRRPEDNHPWFLNSAMAFRRRHPKCHGSSPRESIN